MPELRPRSASIAIGSSRDAPSRDAADAIARARALRGGHVLDVVDWPERTASWLRQARGFAAQDPDAWVVTGQVSGWCRWSGGSCTPPTGPGTHD
ncbi:hypothetical protein ACWDKQ_11810 [Saccharopolyspora sp. NPDC000995]